MRDGKNNRSNPLKCSQHRDETTGTPKPHVKVECVLAFEQFLPRGIRNARVCHGLRGVPLDMNRIHPECPDSDPSDRSADVLFRQQPDEEEDEEEDDEDDEDDDDDDDDGYSE